jgi:V/A-type H+-transporting ATPase subunit D
MRAPAVRSRLLQLRRDLSAAHDGRTLLDQKREAIVRALSERLPRRAARTGEARQALAVARQALAGAQVELGRGAVDGAALAQPPLAGCGRGLTTIASVRVPRIALPPVAFTPIYGPVSGSARLDDAGAAFAAAVASLAALANEDAAVRRLRAALARVARRLNALDHIVLPQIAADIHAIAATLEEDERDETARRRVGSR